jgi:hypothetical protein
MHFHRGIKSKLFIELIPNEIQNESAYLHRLEGFSLGELNSNFDFLTNALVSLIRFIPLSLMARLEKTFDKLVGYLAKGIF